MRAIAYRLDPATVTDRACKAEADRRVGLRPAPDTMAYLTALLPAAQAVAAYAALTAAADTAKAAGDDRGKGQLMADTLVERLTGQSTADDVEVEVGLVMDAEALFDEGDTPAHLTGFGPVPAQWARDLIDPDRGRGKGQAGPSAGQERSGGPQTGSGLSQTARVWVRRLFVGAADGELVGLESHRRLFDGGLRRYVLARDGSTCRMPWCDAPARHLDHVEPHALGGPTSADNGQGLCVRCNLTKEGPRWRHDVLPPPAGVWPAESTRHTVRVTTPTGHTYDSTAPPLLPGRPPPATPATPATPPRPREQDVAGVTALPGTAAHSPAA
ncbi:MAG: nuclease [Humibacillus sp.]|nr:nuclease [Humibacillus sp.]